MKIIFLIFTMLVLSSCQTSEFSRKDYEENPCQDVEYQLLKKKKTTELTKIEINYIETKNTECEEFSRSHSDKALEKKEAKNNLIYILSGLGIVAVLAVVLAITFHGHKFN